MFMNQMKYMIQRLRLGIIIAVLNSGLFFALDIWGYGICYMFGFLSGCLNFILLVLSVSIVTNTMYKKPVLVQRLFLIARYLLLINVLARTVDTNIIEVILFFTGFLSINFSVIITSYKFRLNTKEEG